MRRKFSLVAMLLGIVVGCSQPKKNLETIYHQAVEEPRIVDKVLFEGVVGDKEVESLVKYRGIFQRLFGLSDSEYDSLIEEHKKDVGKEIVQRITKRYRDSDPKNNYLCFSNKVGEREFVMYDYADDGYILEGNDEDESLDWVVLYEGKEKVLEGFGSDYPTLDAKFSSLLKKYRYYINDFLHRQQQ